MDWLRLFHFTFVSRGSTLVSGSMKKITFHHVTVLQYTYHCPRVGELTLCPWWCIISGSHEHLLSLPSVCGCREEADCTYICTCIQTHRHCIVFIVVAVVDITSAIICPLCTLSTCNWSIPHECVLFDFIYDGYVVWTLLKPS